jgi:formimidoylglutamase
VVVFIFIKPNPDIWNGRWDGSRPEDFRFHQSVSFSMEPLPDGAPGVALMGFVCDEGVRRNCGRAGADAAPAEIRKYFANLPDPFGGKVTLLDAGDVVCEGGKLEEAQQELGKKIPALLSGGFFPIIIGGGHETAFGHYLGIRRHIGPAASLGIINIDAHFDLRDQPQASSGTMFQQILDFDLKAGYLVLGIQPFGNTRRLFQTAQDMGCSYLTAEETENLPEAIRKIDDFCKDHDFVMLTLCFDAIRSDAAPGVSAPSPLGLEPKTVKKILTHVAKKRNLLSFDLSEVNPRFDMDGRTARLAAVLLAETLAARFTAQI